MTPRISCTQPAAAENTPEGQPRRIGTGHARQGSPCTVGPGTRGMLEVAAGRQGEVAGAGGEGWGGGETGTAMVAAAETVAAGVAG